MTSVQCGESFAGGRLVCLSAGILNEAPEEGLSVGFVALYGASQYTSKNLHPSYTYFNPPPFTFLLYSYTPSPPSLYIHIPPIFPYLNI